jgi:pimeloyl-ACP methyl ester carboxylesterase
LNAFIIDIIAPRSFMPNAANIYYHAHLGSSEGLSPPVVLIHGAGGTHLYWPSEVRRLPGYRVYAPDLPGHGKSGERGLQSIHSYAQALIDWLDAIDLHSAVLIGHSMGSAIALTLALDHPGRVLGLGLVGAGARLRVAPELLKQVSSPTTFLNAVKFVIDRSFSPASPARLAELAARRMAETRSSVLYGDFLACDEFDVRDRLVELSLPALIISGMDDQMTPMRQAQFLANGIPNAVLKLIPDAGHMVMLEQPQVVATAISEFVGAIPYY